jgi:hypothetical protein
MTERESTTERRMRALALRLADVCDEAADRLRDFGNEGWPQYECQCGAVYRVEPEQDEHRCPECDCLVIS